MDWINMDFGAPMWISNSKSPASTVGRQ